MVLGFGQKERLEFFLVASKILGLRVSGSRIRIHQRFWAEIVGSEA